MKRSVLTCIAALAITSSAQAATPSPSAQRHAVAAAVAYWHGSPTDGCFGQPPSIKYWPMNDPNLGGMAYVGVCAIDINSSADWSYWPDLCQIMVHEWGHLMLGATPFIKTNPMDPSHSLDPRNIMYAGWSTRQPWVCRPPRARMVVRKHSKGSGIASSTG